MARGDERPMADGTTRQLGVSVTPARDGGGTLSGYVVTIRDVTTSSRQPGPGGRSARASRLRRPIEGGDLLRDGPTTCELTGLSPGLPLLLLSHPRQQCLGVCLQSSEVVPLGELAAAVRPVLRGSARSRPAQRGEDVGEPSHQFVVGHAPILLLGQQAPARRASQPLPAIPPSSGGPGGAPTLPGYLRLGDG